MFSKEPYIFFQKSPTYPQKSPTYSQKGLIYSQKSPAYSEKTPIYPATTQIQRHIVETLAAAETMREPYIFSKEPYMFSKEPYIFSKEPYISSKEPCRCSQRQIRNIFSCMFNARYTSIGIQTYRNTDLYMHGALYSDISYIPSHTIYTEYVQQKIWFYRDTDI